MRPSSLCLLLALASTAVAASAQDRVYQWKDAKGVTHYSQSKPSNSAYQTRDIDRSRDPNAPAPAAEEESANCKVARANLNVLSSKASVMIDSDGDGKPDKPLDDAGKAAQRTVAEANIKAYCTASK